MTPQEASARALEICRLAPVIPVLVIDDIDHARPWPRRWLRAGCQRWR
jgi:2-dehydro-3-deoxyphosphogluconate aldolase / (4S)-4-hydroxy-2-oxoglutarate aldolase